MTNKLLLLAEIVQDGFPEELTVAFKPDEERTYTLDERLELINQAIAVHQKRAEKLWLQAGRKRTEEERQATAQADIAGFIFAYLTGDAKEYVDSAVEALETLGRYAVVDVVRSLAKI